MLDPYFGKEKTKTLKKKIYWFLFERGNLIKSNSVLVNSDEEINHLKKTFVDTNGIPSKGQVSGITISSIEIVKGIPFFFALC